MVTKWNGAALTPENNAILSVGTHGEIAIVDYAAVTMFGYCREEMLGRSVEMLLPESHWGMHFAHRPKGIELESKRAAQGGTEFPVDIALRTIVTKHGVQFLSSPTSPRKIRG